ncbi:MAG: hypothetical protein WCC57_00240 [Paracoccaceae bacterium]
MNRIFLWPGLLGLVLAGSTALAGELTRCETSIRGEGQNYVYDPESPTLKESRSLREWLYGSRGAITCPGLVTLRVLTPELNDAERGPFCLQWDRKARTYIGYAEGPRDAWLTCTTPSRSFCERVNRSKAAAARFTGQAAEFALSAGVQALQHPSGAVVLQGPGVVIGEKLVALGSTALTGVSAPVVLGGVAVTAVAVGGAVYVCSDAGAEGAAVDAAPVEKVEGDAAVTGVPVDGMPP